MPSGSKRRKAAAAAKKKKDQEPTPSGSQATAFNGGEDVKGQESDGGEVNSPASQDLSQSGGQSFNEEVGDGESSLVLQVESEKVNVVEEVGIVKVEEDEGVLEITRELKLEEVEVEGGIRDLSVEVGKRSEGSDDGSSSSSSSDAEEVNIEKTEVVQDLAKVEEVYDEVETAEDSQGPSLVIEEVVYVTETAPAEDFQEPALMTEEVVYVIEAAPIEELYIDLDKPVLPEIKTTEEVLTELKTTVDDAPPAVIPTIVSHGDASNVDSFNVNDAEDSVLLPSDSPVPVIRNGVGYHLTEPEIQNSVDSPDPGLPTPLSVQRTSWKGCCGLFEVFTGSR